MPKFLIDEDLPRSLARGLREHGLEAADVRDLGLRGAPDERIWEAVIALYMSTEEQPVPGGVTGDRYALGVYLDVGTEGCSPKAP